MTSYNYENKIVKNDIKKLPWIEKYRPQKINHIISHTSIIQSLKKFIENKTLPHLLFFGPSGSGKTSTIKCCANEIYGKDIDYMTLELNASNERGIETVRSKIKNFVSNRNSIFLSKQTRGIFKLVILDEIDSMTVEAQGMLGRTIEIGGGSTRFCLICNDIDKINGALQSRCTLFRFAPLTINEMKIRLIDICGIEKIKYKNEALEAIIKISKGDMRAAINTLQHVSLTVDGSITSDDIYKISGHSMPNINFKIFKNLKKLALEKTTLKKCSDQITDLVLENNITIFNLLEELKNIVLESDFSTGQKIFLIDNFAKNEIYDSVNVDSKNILMIISSLFVILPKIK